MTQRGWELNCESFGVPFVLRANSTQLLGDMLARTPLGTIMIAGFVDPGLELSLLSTETGCRLMVGEQVCLEDAHLSTALEALQSELMSYVANYAQGIVFVHAGVVAWHGRALLLPGTSFAGKTTLVAELVRAGATYYSDEFALLDEHGLVHPYAGHLQVREGGATQQTPVTVQSLNGEVGLVPVPVARVVFAEYARDAVWNPQPLSAGRAALEMMRHAIPVQRTPGRVMATLARVMESAQAVSSLRGEADETAEALLSAAFWSEAQAGRA